MALYTSNTCPQSVVASWVISVGVFLFLCKSGVEAEVVVKDLNSNETAAIFPDMQASFGNNFPKHGLEGRVIFADPRNACSPIKAAPPKRDKYDWIVVIARGGCQFTDKVLFAQKANFCSAIVYNYVGNQGVTRMGGDRGMIPFMALPRFPDGSAVDIPSTFVGHNSGMALGKQYNYLHKDFIIHIEEEEEIDYRMYLWPFAIVVGVCFLMIMLFLIIKFVRDHTRSRVARLSKKHLKKIPIRKFKKGQYYDTCAICLDEYEDGEKIRVLPCDHAYHTKCIDPWLTRNKKTCPVCKRRVIPGKDPNSEDSGSESEGGSGTSQTTPLLLNSASPRSHGSLRENESGQTQRAHSAPALFEATVVVEQEGGAVGGVGISAPLEGGVRSPRSSGEVERGEQREGGKRRKKERREDSEREGTSLLLGAEEEEEQRKAERKERRKKKKEKKKRQERRARRSTEEEEDVVVVESQRERSSSDGSGGAGVIVEAQVEENVSENNALVSGDLIPGAEERGAEGGNEEEEEEDPRGYINPSYSESQEVVVATPKGRKREMSEVV